MTRMAGKKKTVSNLERRLGEEEYKRIGQEGLQGGIDVEGMGGSGQDRYSAAEVISEFRNSGRKVDEGPNSSVAYFQGLVNDGKKFNVKATDFLKAYNVKFPDKAVGKPTPDIAEVKEPKPSAPVASAPESAATQVTAETRGNKSPVQTGTTTGNDSPVQSSTGRQSPNVNTGGGDSNIAMGRGTIDNSVDNSRYYGGNTRIFNKTGSTDNSSPTNIYAPRADYSTDYSDATMAGFFKPDDSPSASQKFMDFYKDGLKGEADDFSDAMYNTKRNYADNLAMVDYQTSADRMNQIKQGLFDRAELNRLGSQPSAAAANKGLKVGKLPELVEDETDEIYGSFA